ncbi:MAG: sigma-70 family RNA polymerase sigma factor [Acidobacteriota bacterium]
MSISDSHPADPSRDEDLGPQDGPRADVTHLLKEWSEGDAEALDRLIPVVESALRQQARRVMAGERPSHTLDPTALVNEIYLRLVDRHSVSWENRTHFFAFASILMRRVLVEHARASGRQKRGGDAVRIDLEGAGDVAAKARGIDLIALDQALDRLAALDPRQARIVELRYFAGLTIEETASVLEISTSLVTREWKVVKAWLFNALRRAD